MTNVNVNKEAIGKTRSILPILKYFEYKHFTIQQQIARLFHTLAHDLDILILNSEERNAGLQKLLEARDCFVRAALDLGKKKEKDQK